MGMSWLTPLSPALTPLSPALREGRMPLVGMWWPVSYKAWDRVIAIQAFLLQITL